MLRIYRWVKPGLRSLADPILFLKKILNWVTSEMFSDKAGTTPEASVKKILSAALNHNPKLILNTLSYC